MSRKSIVALLAIAAMALLVSEAASARGGFGGYRGGGGGFRAAGVGMGGAGFRAASFGGGYRAVAVAPGLRGGTFAGNAWRAGYHPGYRPWRRFPVAAAAVVGAGLAYGAYPYGYYDNGYYDDPYYGNGYYNNAYYPPYDYDGNYVYNAGGYYGDGGCTIIQRRIPTPYGWVLRPVQVCN